MSETQREKFTRLTADEGAARIDALSLHALAIKIWQKGAAGQMAHSLGQKNQGMAGTLEVVADRSLIFSPEAPIYFSFTLSKMQYFGQVSYQVISTSGLKNHYLLQLRSDLFRTEKREHERLMVYPMWRAYAYFNLPLHAPRNVTSLHRPDHKHQEQFLRYVKDHSYVDQEWGEMVGLQILDISASGLSCLANPHEAELLVNRATNPLVIELKEQIYRISSARIVHQVDYIDPRFQRIRMKKLGIEFSHANQDLGAVIDHFAYYSPAPNKLESSFEDIVT